MMAKPLCATHVLVVEDEPMTADLLRFVLERQGYRTSHVVDGLAAKAWLQGPERVDAMVLDLLLPQLGGLDLLRWLRVQPSRALLPVLVLSALDGDDVAVQAFRAGASDYLRKPFNPDELLARLRRCMESPAQDLAPAASRHG